MLSVFQEVKQYYEDYQQKKRQQQEEEAASEQEAAPRELLPLIKMRLRLLQSVCLITSFAPPSQEKRGRRSGNPN